MSAEQQLYQMFIVEMEKAKTAWSGFATRLAENPTLEDKKEIYKKIFLSAHNLKAASQMCGHADLGAFFHKLEDLISGFSRGKLQSDEGVPEVIALGQSLLERWFLHVKMKTIPAPDCSQFFSKIDLIIAVRTHLESESSNDEPKITMQTQAPTPAKVNDSELQPSVKEARKTAKVTAKKIEGNDKILVPSSGLDEMINLIGGISVNFEIMMHHLREEYALQAREQTSLHSISQTILWLKEACLQIRMQPAQLLLDNLENAAMDVSSKLKKPIQVLKDGNDILLDKSVLEGLFDILLHVVRNAVDHGIENFQTRQEHDKDLIATLTFSVADVGGNAIINISDDGGGIDPQKVLQKAIEKGIVTEDDTLTTDQIVDLIFTPEFSTAKEVTAFSGRGVGMDIVRSAIQAMGGSVQVKSIVGKGTTFKIIVPTQMSLIEAFVITVDQQRYAVPKQDLIEIIDLTESENQAQGYQRTTAIRTGSRMTPAISLRRWFGHNIPAIGDLLPSGRNPESVALVIRKDDLPFAFLVDEVRGMQQVFVRPVPENMASLPAVTGAAVFSNGEPGLILNLPMILNSAPSAA